MDATAEAGGAVISAASSASASEHDDSLVSPTEADGQGELSAQPGSVSRRRSGCNSVEEKRKIRKERKKRKKRRMEGPTNKILREDIKRLGEQLNAEFKLRQKAELSVIAQRNRARTYWECWIWELEKWREAMNTLCRQRVRTSPTVDKAVTIEEKLTPPCCMILSLMAKSRLGVGVFGIVRAQCFVVFLLPLRSF